MPSKTSTKQQERDPIQGTVAAQEFAKALFPTFTADTEAMELAEDAIYDLLTQNPDHTEEEILNDIREAIEAAKAVDKVEVPRPARVFVMFDRLFA
jgi:hypothetical protein